MAIHGLTDTPVLRRDGKIRAGLKQEGSNHPTNTDYFPLHDAAQLIPVLGEKPKEIFFTVYFDDINAVAPSDLRWYTKSDLQCVGDGKNAAYMGSNDLQGLKQEPGYTTETMPDGSVRVMPWNRSRARVCAYKKCPDYLGGQCSEHIRLDMVIPQYGMGSLFTLENTSINGLLNIVGALQKARLANFHRGGKISGEIFRLYKEKQDLAFENPKTGQRSRSPKDVVNCTHVPFEHYEKLFKEKCPPESWYALMALRQVPYLLLPSSGSIQVPQIEDSSGPQQAQLPPPVSGLAQAAAAPTPPNDEEIIQKRAESAVAAPLFGELAQLLGKENTAERRYATAKVCADEQKLVDRLKATIASKKKEQKEKAALAAAPPAVTPAAESTQAPPQAAVLPPVASAGAAAGASLW